ncbi:unnamed protein product, partial [Heterosigma akashiwo]
RLQKEKEKEKEDDCEAAKRRAAHVKLAKDFQRLRALQDALCAEAGRRKARIAEERAKIEAGLEQ